MSSFIRNSLDYRDMINEFAYIDVVDSYYRNRMYELDLNVIQNLPFKLQPVFNPVPKTVNLVTALAVGDGIEILSDDDTIDDFIESSSLDKKKLDLAKDLILGKNVLIRIFNTDEGYTFNSYSQEDYEIKKVEDKIVYCRLEGETITFNGSTHVTETIVEEYFLDDLGNAWCEASTSSREDITFFPDGRLPLVEIQTSYDLRNMLYSTDIINKTYYEIDKVYELAGSPILAGTGLSALSASDREEMAGDRYVRAQTLTAKNPDAQLKLLEIQGTATNSMRGAIRELIEDIAHAYPEFSLNKALEGSNVSEMTTKLRMTEVLASVKQFQASLVKGVNEMFDVVFFLEGKERLPKYVSFGDVEKSNIISEIAILIQAVNSGLISYESARFRLKELYIDRDSFEEGARIEAEQSNTVVVDDVQEPVDEVIDGEVIESAPSSVLAV